MKKIKNILFSGLLLGSMAASANQSELPDFLPQPLVHMDGFFSHHVIVAEKSTHTLHLFKNKDGNPKLVKTYSMVTGKKAGDKIFQGDHRTPEGVYLFTDFLTHHDLIQRHGKAGEIYGVGAFVMNYPNPLDLRKGKTGGGIWLHSTNDETRIEKGLDSRGCVVTANMDLMQISKYIELYRTPIVVVHNLKYYSKKAWSTNKQSLLTFINSWKESWQSENAKQYFSHYHPKEFFDKYRGNYSQFKTYKRAIFSRPGLPNVDIKNLTLLQSEEYAVATFKQVYRSNNINDVGRKTLYLKKNDFYQWKIVAETWSKSGIIEGEDETVAFQPSLRFFETANPRQILGDQLISVKGSN